MIQKGYSTPYDVKCILLKYDDEISKHMKYLNYHDEIDFISECKDRRKYIAKLVNNLKNNVIVKQTKYVQCLDCGEWLEVPVESKTERCDNCKIIHQREQTRLRVKKCRNKTM